MTDSVVSRTRLALVAALLGALIGVLWPPSANAAFDHRHSDWDALLKRHVVVAPGGVASTVRYAQLKNQRDALQGYLASVSAVSLQEYGGWSRPQQLAFLVNAYNAFTVELILTRYPDLKSIKDLGSWFESPWKKKFFRLLGEERSLDELEHGLIRAPGVFDDPRIHVAVVCASVGCPMLRNEAFVADRLDAQLDDALRRFLSDRSRNRFDAASGTLAVSKIFDWYRKDFEQGVRGYDSLQTFFALQAEALGSTPQARADLRAGRYKIVYLDYDWSLNDAR
ncbi:MAG: DUF547 domain-containing protein [Burkholderiaceae bacterium]|nr:DUF547 domain-containing protein [Burkholderiaceae bacterium]